MATFAAVFSPKSASGGISTNTFTVSNLAAATASANMTVGKYTKVAISVTPGNTAATTGSGAACRLSVAGSTANSSDFIIPVNSVVTVDTGAEFDTLSFFNINATTGTLNVTVWPLGNG